LLQSGQPKAFGLWTAKLTKREADIHVGRTIPYTDDLMDEISRKGKEVAIKKKPVKRDVKSLVNCGSPLESTTTLLTFRITPTSPTKKSDG
jgi:hypothetical protein